MQKISYFVVIVCYRSLAVAVYKGSKSNVHEFIKWQCLTSLSSSISGYIVELLGLGLYYKALIFPGFDVSWFISSA